MLGPFGKQMTWNAREVMERSNMYIANVSRNIVGTLLFANQPSKYQNEVQGLFTVPNLLPEMQERKPKNSNNFPEKFIGLCKFEQNYWQQFLHSAFNLNVKTENIDISEHIKDVCDSSNKFFVESLFAEKTSCTYQMKDGKELSYLTFYEKDRIYCKKEGNVNYEWEIQLNDETQYDKIMSFLNGLEDKINLSFTIHNTFWQDFLSGKVDVDAFQEFLSTSEQDEISNGLKIMEDGSFNREETMKYTSYIYGPEFGANMMRTSEELWKWQEKQTEKIGDEWAKTHLSWVEQWNKEHPNLIGVKCIRHSNGQWYTAEEIDKLWDEEMKSDGIVFI